MDLLDRLIVLVDRGVRSALFVSRAGRPSPARDLPEAALGPAERRHAASLMRVNHAGEVCAQALYAAQALAARDPGLAEALARAAREEEDHLAWCEERLSELGSRPSLLVPLWYGGAAAIGLAAALCGDRWSLAFLAETERQVEEHLEGHLARLSPADTRTRAVVSRMKEEEAGHRQTALLLGAAPMPPPLALAMRVAARVMTATAYRI